MLLQLRDDAAKTLSNSSAASLSYEFSIVGGDPQKSLRNFRFVSEIRGRSTSNRDQQIFMFQLDNDTVEIRPGSDWSEATRQAIFDFVVVNGSVYPRRFVRAVLTTCTDLHRIEVKKTARSDRHFQSLRHEETAANMTKKPPDLRLQSKPGPHSEAYDNEAPVLRFAYALAGRDQWLGDLFAENHNVRAAHAELHHLRLNRERAPFGKSKRNAAPTLRVMGLTGSASTPTFSLNGSSWGVAMRRNAPR
jgi:hypothetical protein